MDTTSVKSVTIYLEKKFAVINFEDHKTTIQVNENSTILYSYESKATAWLEKFETLEALLLDNRLSLLDKWVARGMLGIPLTEK